MRLTNKDKNVECRVCRCTKEAPCPKNYEGRTCRQYPWTVEAECAFCTKPSLKLSLVRTPRLIVRTPRFDTHNISRPKGRKGWLVRFAVASLRIDTDKRTPRISKYFHDEEYGGKRDALLEAVTWRDRTLNDLNLRPNVTTLTTVTTTTIVETTETVVIDIDAVARQGGALITNRAQILAALDRERERRRRRQTVKPSHDGISQVTASRRWAEACSDGQVQMSVGKHRKGKR